MLFETNNLNLIYDQDKEVQTYALKNVNISIKQNKFVGVLGPSGSGKSSLLYLLSGLKVPTLGTVKYKDKKLSSLTAVERAELRRKEFGFVFQEHFLIDYMTVLDNVLTPINDNSEESKEKALTLLERLELRELAFKKPYQLAGGQRQRAAIGRALINDPGVIFADELTANLDHTAAREVMKLLADYTKDTTLIVVTHDPTILEKADKIIKLWDGKVKGIEN